MTLFEDLVITHSHAMHKLMKRVPANKRLPHFTLPGAGYMIQKKGETWLAFIIADQEISSHV
jgi:hypothetical protein